MKYLTWLLKAAIFFTLFAFALNNQQDVTVHFFFGTQWTAPLVLVVLAVFAAGLAIGALGMVPRWWKHRRAARLPASEQQSTLVGGHSTLIGQGTPPTHGL
jgi:putative membrane protein